MNEMRLQKYLASCGIASRRQAEEIISAGRVTINGIVADKPGILVTPGDVVAVDGKPVAPEERKVVILYHKPYGEVSTVSDPEGRPTVLDKFRDIGVRLYPIGRLDWDSEGALLLTNDGDLANKLTHPRYEIEKTYLARLEGQIDNEKVMSLRRGVTLSDGMTAPADARLIRQTETESVLLITIHEGRNRQIRRMAEAVGHRVLKLRRVRFASVDIGALKRGEWRTLMDEEVQTLKSISH